MNKAAQEFREVTMKVLSMQLNSIILMNGIAFGGAALAIIMSIYQYSQGSITLTQAFMILVLGAEFFIPLRILGSYFHVAMNGNAACNQLFEILDEEETEKPEPMPTKESYKEYAVVLDHVNFSYTPQKQTLQDVSMRVKEKEFVAMVGKSGCGKSTIAAVVAGQLEGYEGDIYFNERQSESLSKEEKLRKVMCINHNSYIFKGTIKENLRMGNEVATEAQMLEALERVRLKDFILNQGGLSFQLLEEGSNLSGGQKQRLAIARALLRDAQIYLFDEATSNIDQESEEAILEVIHELAKVKTVILISHCLQNVIKADCIYMMEEGQIKEVGNHQALLEKRGLYMDLYERQKQLEKEVKGGEDIA
jgi:ABC-type transport system involved in cytochrome bd biosynthesis fused ATPase/permease subunit